MKTALFFSFAIFLTLASAFAKDSNKIVSIGRNNVDSASVFGNVLHLVKKDEVDSGKYYELSCNKKNRLTLIVVGGDDSLLLSAQTQVENCKQVIRDVYDVAFSETSSADFVISDLANKNGIYELSLSYSTRK